MSFIFGARLRGANGKKNCLHTLFHFHMEAKSQGLGHNKVVKTFLGGLFNESGGGNS